MNRTELLEKIMKYQFYAVDLNLFLDNFPNNPEATKDYEEISCKLQALIKDYENSYGPLTNFGSAYIENPELWISTPWPWENCQGGK